MTWLGLSPFGVTALLGGALSALFVLHLLRVRPRRVRIETLLFAKAAAPTPKPVALWGQPSRWLAFLLGAILLALAVAAAGDPMSTADGPSRLVLDAGDRVAADVTASRGVGPRGGQLAVPGALAARGLDLAAATARPGDVSSGLLRPTAPASRPASEPRVQTVVVDSNLPSAVRLAIAADPDLRIATDRAAITVSRMGSPTSGPALLIDEGSAPADRRAVATRDCPLPLSLRDRRGSNLTALSALPPTAVPWVVDSVSGAPLVASWIEGTTPQIACVAWLLEPLAHRDVPVLIDGSLRLLGGMDMPTTAVVGDPLSIPSLPQTTLSVAGPETLTISASDGGYHVAFSEPGTYRLTSVTGNTTVTVAAGVPAVRPEAQRVPNPWRGAAALLVIAVLLIAIDAWWHHRGRLP